MACPLHCRMLRSLPALHPQAPTAHSPPRCDNQKCPQTLPTVPWSNKIIPHRTVLGGQVWKPLIWTQLFTVQVCKVQPREVPDSLVMTILLLVTHRCPGGIVFVDTSSPCCYEGVNTQQNTHQAQNQLRPGNLRTNTLGPTPALSVVLPTFFPYFLSARSCLAFSDFSMAACLACSFCRI